MPPTHWGLHPIGMITYTRAGLTAVNMAATEPEYRPANITFPAKDTDSDADLAMVARHAMSYAGPFRVELSSDVSARGVAGGKLAGRVSHGPLTVASAPGLIGATLTRDFELHERQEGAYLSLVIQYLKGGRGEIWWRRVGR